MNTFLGFDLPTVSFARSSLFWWLLIVPLLALIVWRTGRARRRDLITFGKPHMIGEANGPRRNSRRWAYFFHVLSVVFLIVSIAGPRWGRTIEPDVIYGRDVIVVLDLSRSMLAQDMLGDASARWEVARKALKDLADAAQRRGGHRLALVLFAARAKVIVPLTSDCDHFRRKLDEIDGLYPPPEISPGAIPPASGTRIGLAIETATRLIDERFPRATDVLLISDGDDPATDDEWKQGIISARRVGAVIDTVGLGDANNDSLIPIGNDAIVEFNNVQITTRLHVEPLRKLAEGTGGIYLDAQQNTPALGEFFRSQIERRESRKLDADALPQPRPRQVWFFAFALVGMVLSTWMELRRQPIRPKERPVITDVSRKNSQKIVPTVID